MVLVASLLDLGWPGQGARTILLQIPPARALSAQPACRAAHALGHLPLRSGALRPALRSGSRVPRAPAASLRIRSGWAGPQRHQRTRKKHKPKQTRPAQQAG
jgi:hypothetical protein